MNIEKEKLVILDEDGKAVALRNLKSLLDAASELYNELKNGELTETMNYNLFYCIEGYISEASKKMNYKSKATEHIIDKYADVRQAYQKIHQLENSLAEKTEVSGVKELLHSLHNAVYEWWEDQGFSHIGNNSFGFFGYKGEFHCDTSSISFNATEPVTKEKRQKSRLEEMIDEGYEFAKEDEREYVLLDIPKNRELITKLVKNKFKSIDIRKWENRKLHRSEGFQLRSFECCIGDLNELKAIMDEMKNKENKI